MQPRTKKFILASPLILAGFLLFIALGAEIVRLLWNWLLPPVFGWREITVWQALALLALCRILFGGFRLGGGSRASSRDRIADRLVDRMADRVAERMERMTPEERERFRQRLRERCGFDPATTESGPTAAASTPPVG